MFAQYFTTRNALHEYCVINLRKYNKAVGLIITKIIRSYNKGCTMYKKIILSLGFIGLLSYTGLSKSLTLEEKIEKRFDYIMNEHGDSIQLTQDRAQELHNMLETILKNEPKDSLSESVQEKFEEYLIDVITKIKQAQETYLLKVATIYKKLTTKKISKNEMQQSSSMYAKHLELFSDELAALIKLLMPFKDIDTMTEEEIQAALTF